MIIELILLHELAVVDPTPPPKRYDHAYHGRLAVEYVTASEAREWCPKHGVACAYHPLDTSWCLIIINKDWKASKAVIMRHEQAHCNGWIGG